MTDGHHIHPRPRGDLVLCDGRCGAELWLGREHTAERADYIATVHYGWLVTTSMLRSYHHCPACRVRVECVHFTTGMLDDNGCGRCFDCGEEIQR